MSDSFHPDLRDLFLDNLMSEERADELLKTADDREALIRDRDLQDQIDLAMMSEFDFDVPTVDQIIDSIQVEAPTKPTSGTRRQFIQLVLAASLLLVAGGVVWNFWLRPIDRIVVFQSEPLVDVYSDLVERDFVPYYECHDEQRFAEVFSKRQGQALVLADLPDDRRMLGISYLGGLSRDTTAMLCKVSEKEVIVFVDQKGKDNPAMATAGNGLQVFREERDGLVFYEVSPFESAKMIQFMKTASERE